MARPASLTLTMPKSTSTVSSTITSPTDAGSESPSPRAYMSVGGRDKEEPAIRQISNDDQPVSPEFTSLPPFPASPRDPPKHAREPSKGFFSNLKASKSSNKVHRIEPTIRKVSEDIPRKNLDLTEHTVYSMKKNTGSTPDLSLTTSLDDVSSDQNDAQKVPRRPMGASVASDTVIVTGTPETSQTRKPKPRLAGLLTRTRSIRMDEPGRKLKASTPVGSTGPEIRLQYDGSVDDEGRSVSPKTAPLRQDKTYRDMMVSTTRNRSADRQTSSNHSQENVSVRRGERQSNAGIAASSSSSTSRDGPGSHLFTSLMNTSNKAAGGLGKAGKTIFGKVSRSGSSTGREDERYTLTVINLPLIEQTRRTRIASRLADSRDKTEFWMPALPWRCIDFLNFKGCEEEGLYRIPGKGDINLFDEPELYDINIIGSMFKAWLRDLPTEILPKETQANIAKECAGATECPQKLKDELSHLEPWNYYLLFAITCHLSLLIAYSDKNKMNFHNLCVCFQPALRIDNFCFQFLVQDWRNCWQGCYTEKACLEREYAILDGRLPSSGSGASSDTSSPGSVAVAEDRSINSSNKHNQGAEGRSITSSSTQQSSEDERLHLTSPPNGYKPSSAGRGQQIKPSPLTFTQSSDERDDHLSTIYSEASSTPIAAGMRSSEERGESTATRTPLPELAPVQPVSPIVHHFH